MKSLKNMFFHTMWKNLCQICCFVLDSCKKKLRIPHENLNFKKLIYNFFSLVSLMEKRQQIKFSRQNESVENSYVFTNKYIFIISQQ